MIPYYSPHFGFVDCLKSLSRHSEQKLIDYFQEMTGKEHILITASCRSALYLAYKSIGNTGVIHTSPLTCQVAVLPILAAGHQVCFHDVKQNDWTLDPNHVSKGLNKDSVAIQANHLGGFPCDIPSLKKLADENGIFLIEDCAQGFGSIYRGTPTGTFGDVACFTLTKNVFGLGGGVLATNRRDLYERAKNLQLAFSQESKLKVAVRMVNAVLATNRIFPAFEQIYTGMVNAKQRHLSRTVKNEDNTISKELKQPPGIYAGSVSSRMAKILALNSKRAKAAVQLIRMLEPLEFRFQTNPDSVSRYTKLFCCHKQIMSSDIIRGLNDVGVEAMHLEQRHGVYYQPKLIYDNRFSINLSSTLLPNYEALHDHLISIPLLEDIPEHYQLKIINKLRGMIDAR